jgi:hypothetical protein
MRVFLSWSGESSRQLALALRDWLPLVLHYVQPWMSNADIPAGERWASLVGRELEMSEFGILCLTRENHDRPWVMFEAGALARSVSESAVCPFLIDLSISDVSGPLTQFQAKKSDREGTLELLTAINGKAPQPVPSGRLSELFAVLWPKLEANIADLPSASPADSDAPAPIRDERIVLDDLVAAVRSLEASVRGFGARVEDLEHSTTTLSRDPTPPVSRIHFRTTIPDLPVPVGAELTLYLSDRYALPAIAKSFGLNPKEYGEKWYVWDPLSHTLLEPEHLGNLRDYFLRWMQRYGNSDPVFEITAG